MGRVYKNYTKELKEQACRMVLESKMPVKMVAERFNVGVQLLYRWINQYETYGDEAFVGSGKLRSEDAKLKKLQKELLSISGCIARLYLTRVCTLANIA